jgi:hypothetical protein
MYQSKIAISKKTKRILTVKLNEFLTAHQKTYCKALKRPVSLDKLPEAILNRKESSTTRLQKFFVALDILRNETRCMARENKGCLEYEIKGLDRTGKTIYIHLREELSIKKDRVLFFVSCY